MDPRPEPSPVQPATVGLATRARRLLFGVPRKLEDRGLFRRISLVPFLAWVGLGADPLSSSAYGPEEAFRTLGSHTYLAVALAVITAGTVVIIASAYRHIIEAFPHGGGGYVVATKLLGERAGVVSGSALLVDYVLTVAVSVAAAGDALFSFLPEAWHGWKLAAEIVAILTLTVLNIRGVRESVLTLMPIFVVFLVTHAAAIAGGIIGHVQAIPATVRSVGEGLAGGLQTEGAWGLLLIFLHAYSIGGGTYTGIEAVANGLPIMREPRVETGRRTMVYIAASLAITAAGLLLCYLLWGIAHVPGKTMNAVLLERLAVGFPGGQAFVILSLFAEGGLLVVAAQAGFIDGPRVLANMAVDSWLPRRFAALSDRLTTQNGIVLMGASALGVLYYTRGDVRHLVVMYSINVFLTFSLSMLGMLVRSIRHRRDDRRERRRAVLFSVGLLLCATVLVVTVLEKFGEGGWLTLSVTTTLVALCFLIRAHYRTVGSRIAKLYSKLEQPLPRAPAAPGVPRSDDPTAAILVAAYGGLGIHTVLSVLRTFPGQFKNMVFVSVGVIDSGTFKGESSVDLLRQRTADTVQKYVALAEGLGLAASSRWSIGMDAVEEAEKLCLAVAADFPTVTFFGGKVVFERERWYQRLLHNETALAVQTRLFWAGKTMVILPARVH